jgi:putative ABC transport system permease protein
MLSQVRRVLARIGELFHRSRIQSEQDEEFRLHLDLQAEHNERLGMPPGEARRAAVLAFGGVQNFREETRDVRGVAFLDQLGRDTRFAVRRLRRARSFTLGAMLTLGIGIGAATGIGSIVYGVLLRELPYTQPDELVRVSLHTPGIAGPGDLHSTATFQHLAAGAQTLAGIGAWYTNGGITATDGEEAERVMAAMVTPGTFRMLGVVPIAGRLFIDADTAANAVIPILIAQELWERRYGADPGIIGNLIELNRGPRRVVGVLPRSFDFPSPSVLVFYPLTAGVGRSASLSDRYLNVLARLEPGVPLAGAEAELNTVLPAISARYPAVTPEMVSRSGARVTLQSLKASVIAPVRGQVILLGIMVVVVLLIALTNVLNLFLLRAERAGHETAIAVSLGAGRLRIAQRFIVEGMVLGAMSVLVALPVAALALATKFGFSIREIPRLHEVAFTPATIAVVVMSALVSGALLGAAAATRTSAGPLGDRLRGTRVTAGPAWRRVQQSLVAVQIAFALTLLVSAALLGRSFWNLRHAELGFRPGGATTFHVSLPYDGYGSYEEGAAFHAQLADRLEALPGVSDVAMALELPLTSDGTPGSSLRFETVDAGSAVVTASGANLASADYFRVMGIPLTRGRTFAPGDLRAPSPAVVLSEALARILFGDGDPLGRQIRQPVAPGRTSRSYEVIGVVGDVHGDRIEAGLTPTAYFPLLRTGDGVPRDSFRLPYVPRWVNYVVRDSVPTNPAAIRAAIRGLDPRVPAANISPLSALVDVATARVRLTMMLLAVASGAALLLGVVGVYSVVSYAADGRLREFGVRLALGASPSGVARLVLREGAVLALAGVIVGLIVAAAGSRYLRSLLYGVSPASGAEYAMAAALLLVIALLAAMVPARRASRTDPGVVLRGD